MLFKDRAREDFNVEIIGSQQLDDWINECVNIYQGNPCWLDEEEHIDTVNFAKAVCSETARLTTLGIGIHVDGSARAEWLQNQIERIYYQLRHWIEYGCACGTIILKPNGDTVDLYPRSRFDVTHISNGEIDGVIFYDQERRGKKWYTKMEYHRFANNQYLVSNKCYVSRAANDCGRRVDISQTPWEGLAEESALINVEKPLFGVLRTPHANNIDLNSPFGLPIYSEAIQELRDLDVAYSRNTKEIRDSKRTILLDADRVLPDKERLKTAEALGHSVMPDYIKLVDGDTSVESDIYHEINPQLNTDTRLKGINSLLSQIGYKVGFSNGYFVFNESSGIQTATEVEADQQRTVQFIKDVRDKLENCMDGLIYALNVFADLYDMAPVGAYEVVYDFSDITYSFEEERAHHYQLAMQGHYPWEEYYVRFLGYSRDDARKLIAMAKQEQKAPSLFGGEE